MSGTWSISKSGTKQEVIDYVKQTFADDIPAHARLKAYLVDELESYAGSMCGVSGSLTGASVSLSISSWDPTPAA